MNQEQAKALVRNTFGRPFDKQRFSGFLRELLNRFDESKAQRWPHQYVRDAYKPHVQRYERFGTFLTRDGHKTDLLAIYLTDGAKLERARTTLRNFVADYLKTRGEKDAALAAFVAPAETTWRFSYIRMEYATAQDESGRVAVRTELTPARRLSYLVGEGESSHTAQAQFLGLLKDEKADPALSDIEAAFSVEAVSDEFFRRYADLFTRVTSALESTIKKQKDAREQFREKAISTVEFAKKLLGQIVFLYFVQKKGWLGVAKSGSWGSGPRDFLRRLANGEFGRYANLFNDVLAPLFYDTLATDRGYDAWCKRFQCRIPFLNGGLFEPLSGYDWQTTSIPLPNELFFNEEKTAQGDVGSGILDVFDRYNFTVAEAEPLEKEVAVDPEMLGKVFENLIEENRRRGLGAYYTPREIVHYMCQEALIGYLDTAVNETEAGVSAAPRPRTDLFGKTEPEQLLLKGQGEEGGKLVPREDLEALILYGEQAADFGAAIAEGTQARTYRGKTLPDSVRSNARAIDERLRDITVCDPAVGSGAFLVGMMTEIVRARLALTHYFNTAEPRSAYLFKRHAIQASLYGVDIDPGAVEIAKLRLWLSLVVDEEDTEKVHPLPNLDYKIVAGDSLRGVEKNLFNSEQLKRLAELKPKFFNESDRQTKARFKRQIEYLIHQLTNGREAFDFEIYFFEVFHSKKGFDVVIANPPYVSVEKFARTALQTEWKRKFKTYASRGDIYCFFYEQGLALLHDGGILSFISSNKFQRSGYGKGLRQLLASQRIRTLIDFCELSVFAAASDPMIVIVEKVGKAAPADFPVLVVKDECEFGSLRQSLASRASRYRPDQLKAEGWSLEGVHGLALVEKLRAKGTPLGDYVKGRFYYGVKTGLNEAFVIDRATRDRLVREDRKSGELIRRRIRGKDIKRWIHQFRDLYVIVVCEGFHTELKEYPAILRHLSKFENKLKARGQCKTSRSGAGAGQHHWLELDNNPSESYIASFAKPKIIFSDIGKVLKAALDTSGLVIGDTGFIIVNPEGFLLPLLLSSVTDWYARNTFPTIGDPWAGGRLRFKYQNMKHVPIPAASPADRARLGKLAERAAELALAGDDAALGKVEHEIDAIAYRLFELTSVEIAQIEAALAGARGGSADDGDGGDGE